MILTGALVDPLRGAAGLAVALAVSFVAGLRLALTPAGREPRALVHLSAVAGGGICAAALFGGLADGFGPESGLVCAGGLVTLLAEDTRPHDGPAS